MKKIPRLGSQKKVAWFKASCLFVLNVHLLIGTPQSKDPKHLQSTGKSPEDQIVERLASLGARVFRQSGGVVEVNLNGTKVADGDLRLLAEFPEIIDLSLEHTQVGDDGMINLGPLQKLEWLNLYRTRLGDIGLKHLKALKSLQHLPVGRTNVTDAGLIYLESMSQL